MSLKSQSHFISPLTGKEVSKATYYRHVKKSQSQSQQQRSHIILETPWEVKEYEAKNVEGTRFAGLHGLKKSAANGVKEMGSVDIFSQSQSQSRSQSRETFSSLDSQYDALFEVFKRLFVAASSRGIPKKIVLECERFL